MPTSSARSPKRISGAVQRIWDTIDTRTHLSKCLVSDDYVVERNVPSRRVQVLISTCVESFSQRRCKKGVNMGSVNRRIYVTEHTQRPADPVITQAQQPAPPPQRRNSIPISTQSPICTQPRSALPIRQGPILNHAKEAPYAKINEVDEDNSSCTQVTEIARPGN